MSEMFCYQGSSDVLYQKIRKNSLEIMSKTDVPDQVFGKIDTQFKKSLKLEN